MSKIKILLVSGQGHISKTIIDAFPDDYDLIALDLNPEDIQQDLRTQIAASALPDLCILNLSYTNGNSESLFKTISQIFDTTPILVLHHYHQKAFAQAFIDMGARAYLPVHFQAEELFAAIQNVLDGQVYISQSVD